MADAPPDPFAAGTANLRDTSKWLVGGIVATAVGVLAGSPLTSLGALEPGPRLYAALVAAALALVLLGILLWYALQVITIGIVSFSQLIAATGAEARLRARVERQMAGDLPDNCVTLAELGAASERYRSDHTRGAQGRYDRFAAAVAALEPRLGFEYKRARFERFTRRLFWLGPFVVVAVGVYAWAANPKAVVALSSAAKYSRLLVDTDSAAVLTAAEGAKCGLVFRPGAVVRTLVIEENSGSAQIITLPVDPSCPPVRLVQQMGRVFPAK